MADDQMLRALEAEERRLLAELENTPAFRKWKLAQKMIAEYRAEQTPETPIEQEPPVERYKSPSGLVFRTAHHHSITKASQVDDAAAEYLNQRGRRATSGELLPVVIAKGITINNSKALSAYLSNSKRFDNVPGFGGYGLIEWNGRRTAPATTSATGGSGGSGGAPNEIIHDGGKLPLNS